MTWVAVAFMENGEFRVSSARRDADYDEMVRNREIIAGPVYRTTAQMAEREIYRLAGKPLPPELAQR